MVGVNDLHCPVRMAATSQKYLASHKPLLIFALGPQGRSATLPILPMLSAGTLAVPVGMACATTMGGATTAVGKDVED